MTQFSYKAISAAGEVLHGQMDAASVEEVIGHLQDQGHTPLQAQLAAGVGGGSGLTGWLQRGPFSGDELAQFTHQLATLLGAGQPLDRALGLLLELPEGEHAKKLVARVRERVRCLPRWTRNTAYFPSCTSAWCVPVRWVVRWKKPCAVSPIIWSAPRPCAAA